ncbi:probable glutathione s-transferase [Phtheirospermum japonicum]|uniref:glutathione transferase n=1 Tax=Phtheirospermum japonicum TaxID=374723 RepID=A0A830CR07_9LAMI|nr:probable glutathione s-transferase [Phtheirospermum japonicum]
MGLKMKGVDYEFIDEDLKNKSALLLKFNPIYKKVPVLLHNGNPIAESLIILEYIDEAFPGPAIWPTDPYERAQARFWAKFIDEKCMPAMWKACWSTGEERDKAKEESEQLLKILENEIKDKGFFGCDKIGVIDIVACFIAYWFGIAAELVGLQLITQDKFPNLCKWADEFCNSIFVKEHLPPKDKLVEGFKFVLQAAAASKGTSSV